MGLIKKLIVGGLIVGAGYVGYNALSEDAKKDIEDVVDRTRIEEFYDVASPIMQDYAHDVCSLTVDAYGRIKQGMEQQEVYGPQLPGELEQKADSL